MSTNALFEERSLVLEHGVQSGPADLSQLAYLGFGHAISVGLSRETGDCAGLIDSRDAGSQASLAVAFEGGSEIVHKSSVKYLTRDGKVCKVVDMNRRYQVNDSQGRHAGHVFRDPSNPRYWVAADADGHRVPDLDARSRADAIDALRSSSDRNVSAHR